MLGAAVVFPALAFVGVVPGIPLAVQLIGIMLIAGPPLSGVYLFPDALTADIIDHDGVRTGQRREAMFYGSAQLVQQAAGSLGPFMLAGMLLLGDTRNAQLGLRLVGPVAGALVFAGWLVFRSYDLPDELPVPAPAVLVGPAP
jgi:GPH family glycoside/pentoside/hexuronide:cation symporter